MESVIAPEGCYAEIATQEGAIILKADNQDSNFFDMPSAQLKNLVRGIAWRDKHFSGMSMKYIAARENYSEVGVRKIINASFDTLMTH